MRRYIERLTRETVVVNLTDGESIKGVLAATHKDCVVLVNAAVLGGNVRVPIDGEAILPRAKIAWLQKLAAEEPAEGDS